MCSSGRVERARHVHGPLPPLPPLPAQLLHTASGRRTGVRQLASLQERLDRRRAATTGTAIYRDGRVRAYASLRLLALRLRGRRRRTAYLDRLRRSLLVTSHSVALSVKDRGAEPSWAGMRTRLAAYEKYVRCFHLSGGRSAYDVTGSALRKAGVPSFVSASWQSVQGRRSVLFR